MPNNGVLRQAAIILGLMGMGLCLLLIVLSGEAHAGAIEPDTGDFTPAPALVSFIAFCIVFGVVLGWLAAIRDFYVMWQQRRRLRP